MKKLFTLFMLLYYHLSFAQSPVVLKEIYPYFGDGYLQINNVLYFKADDGLLGQELWRTDGTANGTTLVKDLYPGARNNHSAPTGFFNFKGTLYFKASVNGGKRLCKSDGTTAGTVVVSEAVTLDYYWMEIYKDKIYFLANIDQLWTTDGTAAGTTLIKDFNTSNGVAGAVAGKDNLYFTVDAYLSGKDALWKSDGTVAGTTLVKDFSTVGDLAITDNGTAFFSADDGTYGKELWKSDGTASGTVMVKNIKARGESSAPYTLFAYKNTIYFNAYEDTNLFSTGGQLWRSDGTEAGTVRVKNTKSEGFPSMHAFERIGDRLVMLERRSYSNKNIYISNGTDASFTFLSQFMSLGGNFGNAVAAVTYPKTPEGELTYFDNQEGIKNLIKYNPTDTLIQKLATVPSNKYLTEGFAMAGRSFVFGLSSEYALYKYDVCQHSAKINTPNGTSFCPGSSVTISAEGTGGTGTFTYQWKQETTNAGTNASLAVTKAGTYSVEVTGNGCMVSTSVEITETTNLPVVITGGNSFCSGQNTTLTANASAGTAPYTYQWKLNGGNVGTNINTHLASAAGVYAATVTDSKGCTGTSNTLSVTSKPSPVVTITASGAKEFLTGQSVVLSIPLATGQTYQWSKDKNAIAGATNNSYTVKEEGSYTVTVILNGCSATSEASIVSLILANEPVNQDGYQLTVSPNPAVGEAKIVFITPKPDKAEIIFYDISGRKLGKSFSNSIVSRHEVSFNITPFSSGIYFIKAKAINGKSLTFKFLKN